MPGWNVLVKPGIRPYARCQSRLPVNTTDLRKQLIEEVQAREPDNADKRRRPVKSCTGSPIQNPSPAAMISEARDATKMISEARAAIKTKMKPRDHSCSTTQLFSHPALDPPLLQQQRPALRPPPLCYRSLSLSPPPPPLAPRMGSFPRFLCTVYTLVSETRV